MNYPIDIFQRVMDVLTSLSQGRTKTAACDLAGISTTTFDKYTNSTDELRELCTEAEVRGYDTMAELLLHPFDPMHNPTYAETDVKKAKVVSDNIKWFLQRRAPARYGERVEVVTHVTLDRAIINALERGRARATAKVLDNVTYNEQLSLPSGGVINIDGIDEELLDFV